jgi:hypothetical protein
LAPLYDTLSTAVYPTLTPKMAMKIGSKYKFSEVLLSRAPIEPFESRHNEASEIAA